MKNDKTKRFFTLILPLSVLLLFVGLFVGSGISRCVIRKELKEMKDNTVKREGYDTRLKELEKRNKKITLIIGRDKSLEKQIEELKN